MPDLIRGRVPNFGSNLLTVGETTTFPKRMDCKSTFAVCGSTTPTLKMPDLIRGRVPIFSSSLLPVGEEVTFPNRIDCNDIRESVLALLVSAVP